MFIGNAEEERKDKGTKGQIKPCMYIALYKIQNFFERTMENS